MLYDPSNFHHDHLLRDMLKYVVCIAVHVVANWSCAPILVYNTYSWSVYICNGSVHQVLSDLSKPWTFGLLSETAQSRLAEKTLFRVWVCHWTYGQFIARY